MKFVLATANPGKIKEMRDILGRMGFDVVSRSDVGVDFDIEETGTSFKENAMLKAQAICKATGLPAIADDSGLVVDALGGEPGVYSSSYGSAEFNDIQRCDYLIKKMQGMEQRAAKFVCTIICLFPNGESIVSEGECYGEILGEPRGTSGFGYDPVFLVSDLGKTMAELSADEKNEVSHRGNALRKFAEGMHERRLI